MLSLIFAPFLFLAPMMSNADNYEHEWRRNISHICRAPRGARPGWNPYVQVGRRQVPICLQKMPPQPCGDRAVLWECRVHRPCAVSLPVPLPRSEVNCQLAHDSDPDFQTCPARQNRYVCTSRGI